MTEPQLDDVSPPVVARAGTYYRNARYLLTAFMFAAGLWFAYDGWVNWPAERQRYNESLPSQQVDMKKPHTETDIFIQRALAIGLVPLAPILLAFFLYNSRGEIRLSGNTLSAPGHPPVPLENILELDKTSWERKGIAYVEYKLADSPAVMRIKLDDFVYQRGPIDAIVKQIDATLAPAEHEAEQDPELDAATEPTEPAES